MSLSHSPSIVTSNLNLCLDANNLKSYPGSGTLWTDLTSNSFNGTLTVGQSYSWSSVGGGSIVFDGIDDVVTLPDTNYPAVWSDPLSLEIWINVPGAATWSNGSTIGNIILRGTYTGHIGIGRVTTDNVVTFSVRGDTAQSLPLATIGRDSWYQIVGTWNGSIATIYVNGAFKQASSPITHTGVPEVATWRIGDNSAFGGNVGNFFNGYISNVKMYKKTLSESEVLQNYNALRGRFGL